MIGEAEDWVARDAAAVWHGFTQMSTYGDNLVRLTVAALAGPSGPPVVTILNRFDRADGLHRDNLSWLRDRDGLDVVTEVDELADRLR
ncbi:MAG: hypothetical protein ABW310_17485 [Acidimicrobiales bacterium]